MNMISEFILEHFKKRKECDEDAYEEDGRETVEGIRPTDICCNGKIVAFSSYKTFFVAFDCQSGKVVGRDKTNTEGVGRSIGINPEGSLLYVGTDRDIRVYDVNENFRYMETFGGNTAELPYSKYGGIVQKEESDEIERLKNGHNGHINHIRFSKDYVISGGDDGWVAFWKRGSHEFVGKIKKGGYVTQMDISGDILAIGRSNGNAYFYNIIRNFEEVGEMKMKTANRFAFCGGLLFVAEDELFYTYKMTSKGKMKLLKKDRLIGYKFGRRLITDANPLVFGSGRLIMMTCKERECRMYDVKSKNFKKGLFDDAMMFCICPDLDDYDDGKFNYAAFCGVYVYIGIGSFTFSRWKIKEK